MSGKGSGVKKLPFDEGLESDSSDSSDDENSKDHVDSRPLGIHQGGNQEEDSDSNSNDSESDMDVDNDGEIERQLAELNQKLLAEPYNYDLLVTKINLLRVSGDLELLRSARERMSQLYPLSEKLWLEWIQDELKLSETPEEKKAVRELFERAVKDYLSVEIWLEYIQYALSEMSEEGGIQRCRDICERALSVAGLHVSLGSLLWDSYRDFEAAIIGLCSSEDERVEQEKRYTSLCRRQLSVPLLGMEEKFEDISSKIDLDEGTITAYKAALKKLSNIESFEQELILAQDDLATKAAAYRNYIEAEKADKSNPARIQCLFERAVADCPLDSSLWLEYIQYISTSLKIPDLLTSVAERASRNCPWVIEIWTEYFVLAEKYSSDNLVGIFERAVANFATVDQVGTLWLKYLESLRRLLRSKEFPQDEVDKFVANAEAAERHILQLGTEPEPNEYVFQVVCLKLRLLASTSKKLNGVRESWKDLLQRGYGHSARNWLQFLLLEKEFGDVASCRQLFSKAASYVKDDLHSIASLWLNLERDHGEVGHLRACEKKINKLMEEFSTAAEPSSHNPTWSERKFQDGGRGNDGKKRKNLGDSESVAGKKRKGGEDTPDGHPFKVPVVPALTTSKKKSEETKQIPAVIPGREKVEHDSSKDDRTVFVSNLAFTCAEENLRDFFSDVGTVAELRLVKDFKGRPKGYAYVVFESRESVAKALEKDRHALAGRPAFVNKCDPDKSTRPKGFKFATRLEKNKLFVKGLPTNVTEEKLRELFSPFGPLKAVRVATFRNGFSKGIAYVDYEDEVSAAAAVKEMNEKEIEGKNIFVAISNPPPKKDSKNLPSDMQFLQRRAPTAFVPRSLQVQKTDDSSSGKQGTGPSKPMSNEDFKKLLLLKRKI